MLALLGLATVLTLLVAVLARAATPLVALIVVPVVAGLVGGFGAHLSGFAIAGIQQTAPVAAMFVFAVVYFGVMTDAGMLDPIVEWVLTTVGTRPSRITV